MPPSLPFAYLTQKMVRGDALHFLFIKVYLFAFDRQYSAKCMLLIKGLERYASNLILKTIGLAYLTIYRLFSRCNRHT